MDLFDIPDDYVPEKYLTDQEMDNITNYLKNHPLFMKELPQNIEENQHLVALQALKDNDDPNVEAESLCLQGNDIVKKNLSNIHYLKAAYEKYTQGINLKPTDPTILAKLHCNRALINLKLKNYGKVIIDCKICLKYDPNYTKAYYRCTQAFIAVKRYSQALELLKNRQEKQLDQLRIQVEKQLQKLKQKEQKKQKQMNEKLNQIQQYCKKKNYHLIKRNEPLPQNAKVQFIQGKLSIPILFAYPQFGQMDLIAHTTQQQKIRTYLQQLFQSPLPWDVNNNYSFNQCELFYEINENKIMRIPKQAKIQELAKRMPMKGALEITILAKGNKFYEIFLKGKQIV